MKTNNTTSTILCHRCRWGATPGNLTMCRCPDLPNDLNDLRDTDNPEAASRAEVFAVSGGNPVAWALPSIAVASGQCRHFATP